MGQVEFISYFGKLVDSYVAPAPCSPHLAPRVDVEKLERAVMSQSLCQSAFHRRADETAERKEMLCFLSAAVAAAGVQPALIGRMMQHATDVVPFFFEPVLQAEYGLPRHLVHEIPGVFDRARGTTHGVTQVLKLCVAYNKGRDHEEALQMESARLAAANYAATEQLLTTRSIAAAVAAQFSDQQQVFKDAYEAHFQLGGDVFVGIDVAKPYGIELATTTRFIKLPPAHQYGKTAELKRLSDKALAELAIGRVPLWGTEGDGFVVRLDKRMPRDAVLILP